MQRTPFSLSDDAATRDPLDVIGTGENQIEWKTRKTRSKQEQAANPSEFRIQAAAIKQLRLLLPPEYIVVSWRAESGDAVDGMFTKAQGYLRGWPDSAAFGDGRAWFIEWKTAKGPVQTHQTAMHATLRAAGFPVAVCRSLEDATAFLAANGARFRGRIAA